MTSQGTASGRFTRAIERRNLFQAELALREMGTRSLLVALDYLELGARTETGAVPGCRGGVVSSKPGRSPSLSRSTRTPRSVLSERGSVKWSTCRTLVSAREVLEARARGQLKRNARIELCRLSAGHASRRTFGAGSTVTLVRRFG
jgi:hypothetical protein